MRIWPVFKKEMRLYATSPIAYVVFFIFLAVMGWFFYQILSYFSMASMRSAMNPQMARDLNVTDSVMRPLFGNLSVILVLALMPFALAVVGSVTLVNLAQARGVMSWKPITPQLDRIGRLLSGDVAAPMLPDVVQDRHAKFSR